MYDNEIKQKFIELRAQGLSFDKISVEMDISKQTLLDWSRDYENEISNLAAMELDALKEMHFGSKKARIELYSKQIQILQAAIDERAKDGDFYTMDAAKMFDLLTKFSELIKKEYSTVTFNTERYSNPNFDFGGEK